LPGISNDFSSIEVSKEMTVKIAYLIARLLLGLVMLVFGVNIYLQFIPAGPIPPGPLADFNHALLTSHYIYALGIFEVVPGILLLVNRYVPLALAMLAPVIVNICFIHIFMAPSGLPLAAIVVILWLLIFYRVRGAFSGIFRQNTPEAI
jgi:putative oxidoreductase